MLIYNRIRHDHHPHANFAVDPNGHIYRNFNNQANQTVKKISHDFFSKSFSPNQKPHPTHDKFMIRKHQMKDSGR
jgi:hypothetical protein